MKKIKVVKEESPQKIFSIQSYSFILEESENAPIPVYKTVVKKHFSSPLDIRYWFEEISSGIQFLSETPSELTEYIKNYEENSCFTDICLFHDLRTRYIDFLLYDQGNLKNNVLLIGYTLLENEVYIVIKSFSLEGLVEFTKELIRYCNSNEISIENNSDLRWMQLEQCILPATNLARNDMFDSFLQKSLQTDYCDIFLKAFQIIDSQGYLDKSFYDSSVIINGHDCIIRDINQFTKYFSLFWKTDISIKEISRTVLYLHDEILNEESINKIVYTIKPHLMQYYQLHWFEDFCDSIIKNTAFEQFKIVNSYSGRKFNFFQNGNCDDIREIDLILGIVRNNTYKIIAVECKKTLSKKEITVTNRKIKDKILKSYSNVIDAYIHIGCFNNDVEFDKCIEGSHERYKQGLIQLNDDPKIDDVPYFAFSISSIENFQLKFSYVVENILEQW
jgi:hypothetical protein